MPDHVVHCRFPRYQIQLPLRHKPKLPSAVRAGVGWTRDLSEGGVCVELAERFQPYVPLQVHLQTDGGPIAAEAHVVWGGRLAPVEGGFLHGFAFTQVTASNQAALRDLIRTKGGVRPAGLRLPLVLQVTCEPRGLAGPRLEGWTGDLSRGGLLLRLPQLLAPGTVLELSLRTPHGPLTVEGAIVWAGARERQTHGESIRHGLRFTAVSWSTTLAFGLLLVEAL